MILESYEAIVNVIRKFDKKTFPQTLEKLFGIFMISLLIRMLCSINIFFKLIINCLGTSSCNKSPLTTRLSHSNDRHDGDSYLSVRRKR